MNTDTTPIQIDINGQTYQVPHGLSVAAALALCGLSSTRRSVSGELRAPVCGMGICQECRVSINERAHQLACQSLCTDGMRIEVATNTKEHV